MVGGWAVGGPDALPPAWAVVSSSAKGEFRVIWVGADTETAFAAPGGDPVGVVPNGASSLRFGLTGREGILATDTGRTLTGSGEGYLHEALAEIVSGATTHGGALLAPLGVRFVVAQERRPSGRRSKSVLDAQVDLDREGASGLVIYRNAVRVPPAAVFPADEAVGAIVGIGGSGRDRAAAVAPSARAGCRRGRMGRRGARARDRGGVDGVRPRLGARGHPTAAIVGPREAFGWSTAFDAPAGSVRVRFTEQWVRTVETLVLGLLWLAALWVTRKPVAR